MNNTHTETVDGFTVNIFNREGKAPHGFDIESANGAYFVEGMLIFEGKSLQDFDGAYFLPPQVAKVLRGLGFTISKDFLK